MLKIPYQKLRLISKGNLNLTTSSISNNNGKSNSAYSTKTINGSNTTDNTTNNSTNSTIYRIGRRVLQGIPVLSIFAFLGILSMMISLDSSGLVGFDISNKAYAEEPITPYATTATASLSIGGAGETEQVVAGRGTVTYRTHTVRVQASEINNYSLTISGPSNLVSPTGSGSESTITGISNKTGGEMGTSSTYDNTWGYGWGDTSTSEDNLVYRTLSTTGTNILTVNGSSDKPALSNRAIDFTRKLVFAVKFGENAAAGRYYANVTLSLTASPAILTTYSVTYDCNGGTGCPSNYSESSYDESKTYTIPSTSTNNPTKTGYNFLGYSTNSAATTADSNYAPGRSITLTQASSTRTLYAVWEKQISTIKTITNMQDITAEICKASTIGDTNTLTDTRDNSTYTVRKHEDGNCWMTQNLRIVNKTITSSDSDVTSNFTIPASNISSFGTSYNTNSAYYNDNLDYGAYYSWYTATAGAGTSSVSSGDVTPSICPKGWRLPSQSDYASLATAIGAGNNTAGSNTFRNTTYNFQYAGYAGNGSLNDMGSIGYYLSRTVFDSSYVYNLRLSGSNAGSASFSAKYFGLPVRCVAYSS